MARHATILRTIVAGLGSLLLFDCTSLTALAFLTGPATTTYHPHNVVTQRFGGRHTASSSVQKVLGTRQVTTAIFPWDKPMQQASSKKGSDSGSGSVSGSGSAAKPKAAGKKKADAVSIPSFKKADFVAAVADKTGLNKTEAEVAMQAVVNTITEQVSAGKRVSLSGFGTFTLKERAARKGRNPQTGEALEIAARKVPGFSAAKAWKESLKSSNE